MVTLFYIHDTGKPKYHKETIPFDKLVDFATKDKPIQCGQGFLRSIARVATKNGDHKFVASCSKPILQRDGYITIAITLITLTALLSRLPPDITTLTATLFLVFFEVIDGPTAWAGFANEIVLSVAVLGVVAKACENTGVIELVFEYILGTPKSLFVAELRILIPTAMFSAFINNTPVVAILMGVADSWAPKIGQPVTKFLLPISFAAMLGGVCSIFGTSSNLIAQSLLMQEFPDDYFGVFEMTPVAAIIAVVNIIYIAAVAPYVISDGAQDEGDAGEYSAKMARQYLSVMAVTSVTKGKEPVVLLRGSTDDQTQKHANIPQLSIINNKSGVKDNTHQVLQVDRRGTSMHFDTLHGGESIHKTDIVWISSSIQIIADMLELKDLTPISLDNMEQVLISQNDRIIELVLSEECDLTKKGADPSEFDMAGQFDIQILGIRKKGRIPRNYYTVLGEDGKKRESFRVEADTLQAGDGIIVRANEPFLAHAIDSEDFHYVNVIPVKGTKTRPTDMCHMVYAGVVLILLIVSVSTKILTLFPASLSALLLLVFGGCLTTAQAFAAIKLRTVLTIVGTFGLGAAFKNTGVAQILAEHIIAITLPFAGAIGILVVLFILTFTLGSFFHSTATVILMFPICVTVVQSVPGITLHQAIMVLMQGASAQWLTPISYQTNLMVYEAGNYEFCDFAKLGVGMEILTVVLLIPLTYTFIE